MQSFPEVDRAAWFAPDEAREKILPGQGPFIDRLLAKLAANDARLIASICLIYRQLDILRDLSPDNRSGAPASLP